MYHLIIGSSEAIEKVKSEGVFRVKKHDKTKKQQAKTFWDIKADLYCVKKGDGIIIYDTDKQRYRGEFVVTKECFYYELGEDGQEDTLCLGISAKNLYKDGVGERELLNMHDQSLLRFPNVFYKKALGRGKVCTHLYRDEFDLIVSLINQTNSDKTTYTNEIPVSEGLLSVPSCDAVQFEKVLEAFLAYNLRIENVDIKVAIMGENLDIEYFGNYIPISIQGHNIDLMIETKLRYYVVELKRDKLKNENKEQTLGYSDTYYKWHIKERKEVIPVIIGNGAQSNYVPSIKSLEYAIVNNRLTLKEITK